MNTKLWCQWALFVVMAINFSISVHREIVGRQASKPGGARGVARVLVDAALTFMMVRGAGALSEVFR